MNTAQIEVYLNSISQSLQWARETLEKLKLNKASENDLIHLESDTKMIIEDTNRILRELNNKE